MRDTKLVLGIVSVNEVGKRHRGAEMTRESLDVKIEKGASLVNAKSFKNVNCGCAHFRV